MHNFHSRLCIIHTSSRHLLQCQNEYLSFFPISQLKVNTELRLEVSYYNIRNDSWEPILEPIVDPDNKDKYTSWCMKVSVVRQPPTHSKHHVEGNIHSTLTWVYAKTGFMKFANNPAS